MIEPRCWERHGVNGDRSCAKLAEMIHCRNCPTYIAASRELLDRPPPPGYREEWTTTLARETETARSGDLQVMVFRLGKEWLAVPTRILKQVAEPRPWHAIPHRGGLLAGVVNIEGELHLLVRLGHLLGMARPTSSTEKEAAATSHAAAGAAERMMVIELRGSTWVFFVNEIVQLAHVSTTTLAPPPATLTAAPSSHTRGTFVLREREVALLDEDLLARDFSARLGRPPMTEATPTSAHGGRV